MMTHVGRCPQGVTPSPIPVVTVGLAGPERGEPSRRGSIPTEGPLVSRTEVGDSVKEKEEVPKGRDSRTFLLVSDITSISPSL